MSEARRNSPREVPNVDNVMSRLATLANTYVRYVTDKSVEVQIPIPCAPRFVTVEDVTKDLALHLRVLNWAYVHKAAGVESAALAKSTASDADKVAHATTYLNGGYKFTSDLGGEWSNSLLELATDRVLFEIGVAQKKCFGSYDANNSSALVAKRRPTVTKILTDPALADKYTSRIQEMVATILAERPPMQKRGANKTEVVDDIEL